MSRSLFQEMQAKCLSSKDIEYPHLLKEIPHFPEQIWIKGNPEVLHKQCFTVVGTRKMTVYGKQAINILLPRLISAGLVITSGLALGVDAYAHEKAVSQQMPTIAVLAQGISTVYPKANEALADRILSTGGAIISEFEYAQPGQKYLFPMRNRILAGLSMSTLVIEAGIPSGSLITANHAAEFGRSVMAVPGPLTNPYSEGTKKLINLGAELVTSSEDILRIVQAFPHPTLFHESVAKKGVQIRENETEQRVIDCLQSNGNTTLETMQREVCAEYSVLLKTLTDLEIQGVICRNGGAYQLQSV